MAIELRDHNIAAISFWPCAVKSELFMDCGLVSENYVSGDTEKLVEQVSSLDFQISSFMREGSSIEFPGKCVVGMATDPDIMSKSGHIVTDMECAKDYNLIDDDGSE